MDAVALVRRARHDLAEEDHVVLPLLDGNMVVPDPLERQRQFGQLMVMGGEKGFGPDRFVLVEVFRHRPGDAQAVERAGPPPHLIQQDEALGGRAVQDVGRLQHFDHEGGLADVEKIHGPDPGEDPVHDAEFGAFRGDEGSHLGHQDDQRDLAEIGRFAAHVGARDDQDLIVGRVEESIVGDERFGVHRLDDGVTSPGDPDGVPLPHDGPPVVPPGRKLRQGQEHVHQGDGRGDGLQPARLAGHRLPRFQENPVFEAGDPLLGVQDLVFMLLELGRQEPLRAEQRLPADVIGRDEMEVGLGDVDRIAEIPVVADLERRDPRPLPFPLFDGGDDGFPRPGHGAQVVELRVVAVLDDSALGEQGGRLVQDRPIDRCGDIAPVVPGGEHIAEDPRSERFEEAADSRQGFERLLQGHEIPGMGGRERDLSRQPLQVMNPLERLADFIPFDRQPQGFRHGVQPGIDPGDIPKRPQHPAPEHPASHGRHGEVHEPEKGVLHPSVADIPDKLQVSDRGGIQDQVVIGLDETDSMDEADGTFPDLPDVAQERARGGNGQRLSFQAEPGQGTHAKMLLEEPGRGNRIERPGFDRAPEKSLGHPGRQDLVERILLARGKNDFAGRGLEKFVGREPCLPRPSLERPDLPGDEIDQGQAPSFAPRHHGGDEDILPGLAVFHFDGRARGQDLDHLAFDHAARRPGVFHLLADGDLEPLAQELGQVGIDGVMGHAAHGDLLARGQGDPQDRGGRDRVLIEHLVKIPQAEEKESVRMLPLDPEVLVHHRSRGILLSHGDFQLYSPFSGLTTGRAGDSIFS